MKQLLGITIAFVLVASAALAQDKSVDRTVFGILTLGESLTVHECSKLPSGKYLGLDSTTCYEDEFLSTIFDDEIAVAAFKATIAERLTKPLRTGGIIVTFNRKPDVISGNGLWAQVIDGNVEYVKFETAGVADASKVFEALAAKYGPPSKTEKVNVKNMAGAEFSSTNAQWTFENLSVIFKGAFGRIDRGIVIIATKKGLEFEGNIAKSAAGPKL